LSRDTLIPGAGFGSCFRLAGPGVLSSRWRVLPYLRCTAANAVGRSHTRIEVPSSRTWPWQSRLPGIRCALEMISSPHTVLCNRRAAHGERAREAPARGRGSPPAPDAGNRRRCQSQSEGPIKARGSGIGGLVLVISFAIFGHLGCSTTSAPQVPRQHPLPYDSRYHAGLSTWRTLPWTPFWPRRLGRLS
jgi:hypothetical protein